MDTIETASGMYSFSPEAWSGSRLLQSQTKPGQNQQVLACQDGLHDKPSNTDTI